MSFSLIYRVDDRELAFFERLGIGPAPTHTDWLLSFLATKALYPTIPQYASFSLKDVHRHYLRGVHLARQAKDLRLEANFDAIAAIGLRAAVWAAQYDKSAEGLRDLW